MHFAQEHCAPPSPFSRLQVDEDFQQSDTLKGLLERSEANRAKNKKEVQNKYVQWVREKNYEQWVG